MSRSNTLASTFGGTYGTPPTHVARAPGRVNLVGEHVDYLGLSVLPVALDRGVSIAFRPRGDDVVRLVNVDDRFSAREFRLGRAVAAGPVGDWGNYPKAAAQGLAARVATLRGIDAVVTSDLPVAAGLSSSSALVVATALALLAAGEVAIAPLELAELLAGAERYVGTRGGGMDQAICLGAEPGAAGYIGFAPLRIEPIPVPADWHIVVAYSGRQAAKSGSAQRAYNERTEQCRAALDLVAAAVGVAARDYPSLLAALPPERLLAVAARVLDGTLRQRFRHVVSEAGRVHEAVAALREADLARFGAAMNASHASLRYDYEVSTPELDRLVTAACAGGAAGARLTGAGFGGCVVALTSAARVSGVQDALVERYYRPEGMTERLDADLFVAIPAGAASVERW